MNDRETDVATEKTPSWLARLKARLLPEMPDFYALLIAQCEISAEGTGQLVQYLKDSEPEHGMAVRRLEHEGDRLRARNLETLHRSFATPMDREDFYDAIMAIDEILNYAKTSVREVEILDLAPDRSMVEMAELVNAGTRALLQALHCLEHEPETAARHGEQARKAERAIEKAYRGALARLFDPAQQPDRAATVDPGGGPDRALDQYRAELLEIVTQMLKRREIYRHLSNAGDHVANAARIVEDIVSKAT
jgi:hypothetical protein